jgi:RNA polymerase sigma factor (sigma-70 family)
VPLTGAAAARLYDDHVDAVHALITRRVGPGASPDITGEAFEHALRTWVRFDSGRGTERLFLFGAATAVIRRHAETERDHLTRVRMPLGVGGVSVHDPLVAGQRRAPARVVDHAANSDIRSDINSSVGNDDNSPAARTMRAIANLAPDDRDIVLLSLWESCPQGAIAEVLDLSVGAVRSALGRIRRELKIAVQADGGDAS